ncbi:hypothetical protein R1sor_004381 [Riccia sorocarpa]|uniref:DNL-type domain-containing protein n=1 Tax=Riccia sorocarpa TaxID=122646 RepID=A0ABD3HKA6_9MARC
MAAASVTVPSVLQASFCSGIESRSSRKGAAVSAVSFSAKTAYTSVSSVFPSVIHPRNYSCCSKLHAKSARHVLRAAARSEGEIRHFGAHEALKVIAGLYNFDCQSFAAAEKINPVWFWLGGAPHVEIAYVLDLVRLAVSLTSLPRLINPEAYRRGTVFVQCAGCEAYHQLVDNLNLIEEFDFRKENGSSAE